MKSFALFVLKNKINIELIEELYGVKLSQLRTSSSKPYIEILVKRNNETIGKVHIYDDEIYALQSDGIGLDFNKQIYNSNQFEQAVAHARG